MSKERTLVQLSLAVVMTALVAECMHDQIPNPMGSYFNVGDVLIFVSALTFGPLVGGFAGGVGSAIADIIGFPLFAVPTLIIKGLEGFIAGLIADKRKVFRDVLAVCVAGSEMTIGYFLVEQYPQLAWGLGGALAEVPGNVAQIVIGGVVGIPVALVLRRRLPEILKYET